MLVDSSFIYPPATWIQKFVYTIMQRTERSRGKIPLLGGAWKSIWAISTNSHMRSQIEIAVSQTMTEHALHTAVCGGVKSLLASAIWWSNKYSVCIELSLQEQEGLKEGWKCTGSGKFRWQEEVFRRPAAWDLFWQSLLGPSEALQFLTASAAHANGLCMKSVFLAWIFQKEPERGMGQQAHLLVEIFLDNAREIFPANPIGLGQDSPLARVPWASLERLGVPARWTSSVSL